MDIKPYWERPENAKKVKPASIRDLSKRLRPSHFMAGGGIDHVFNPVTKTMDKVVIPTTLIENDRQDPSRARRDALKRAYQGR